MERMSIGPVEYIVVEFPGNQFTGEIVPELASLVDRRLIRIIDLVFIGKTEAGEVVAMEVDEDEGLAVYTTLDGDVGGFIGEEDIRHAAAGIEPGSSAALLVWEDVWATPLAEAIRRAGGVLVEGSRIPHDLVEAAEAALDAAS